MRSVAALRMILRKKGELALALSVLFVAALHGQNLADDEIRYGTRPYVPRPSAAIRAQTNLVEVRVVVRDGQGQPVGGLQKSDFQIFDNGKPQTVSAFTVEAASRVSAATAQAAGSVLAGSEPPPAARAAAPPRYVALFFDDNNMKVGELVPARTAAEKFINGGLEPGDRVGIFTSSSSVSLEFTSDKQKLSASLAQLRTHFKRPDEGPGSCPHIGPHQAHLIVNMNDRQALDLARAEAGTCPMLRGAPGLTTIIWNTSQRILSRSEDISQDTIGTLTDVVQYLGKMPGRRTLVLTSAGFFTVTLQRQQGKLIDAALHAEVTINSLDAKGLVAEVPGGDPGDGPPIVIPLRGDMMAYADRLRSEQRNLLNDPLGILAEGTGGRFFHNNNDLDRGLRELAAAPEVSYLLGFSPENLILDGRYHNLKVALTGPRRFTLEARRGYFAPDKSKPAPLSLPEKFDAAVLASDELAGLPIDVAPHLEKLDSGEAVLRVTIHVDARTLRFQRRADRNVQRLRFVTALFDTQGKYLAGVEAAMDLALKDATLASFSAKGLDEKLSLQAPAGSYRLRAVVQELLDGRIAAVSRPLEIR